MPFMVERFDACSWPDEQLDPLFDGTVPPFISADPVAAIYVARVREMFGELHILLIYDDDRPAAVGWSVPVRWSGEVTDLPSGYTDTIRRAVEGRERGEPADTFVICGGIADRNRPRQELAGELIGALCDLPAAANLPRVIAQCTGPESTVVRQARLTPVLQWRKTGGVCCSFRERPVIGW